MSVRDCLDLMSFTLSQDDVKVYDHFRAMHTEALSEEKCGFHASASAMGPDLCICICNLTKIGKKGNQNTLIINTTRKIDWSRRVILFA